MTDHRDSLAALDGALPLREKLIAAHRELRTHFPFVVRIAVALHDPATDTLATYVHSTEGENPLDHYQASMAEAPSLRAILAAGSPRVINQPLTFDDGDREHTRRIGRAGYAASYTLPMFDRGTFVGFVFFNADQREVFTEPVLRQLDLHGHLISLLVINELASLQTLQAAVRTTGRIAHVRDPETGSHLDRMSRYARLIARALAESWHLDDGFVEHLFMFAPLHDIGKVGIPDRILHKQGRLDAEEMEVMRTHARLGEAMIDDLVDSFGLEHFDYRDVLRNIAASHHEAMDGSGYPRGLAGEEIPIEARIVAVADVFDALTSKRPYKEAWSNARAVALLQELAGSTLDRACVDALVGELAEVERIQARFREKEL